MNKYIVRTSLVWLGILIVVAGILVYHSRSSQQADSKRSPMPSDTQPVAAGPASSTESMPPIEERVQETNLSPLQLSPERMQSIGVKTGPVEYKQLTGDIRATGTVNIDERLVSYVQVRFPGYIRKVFVNATYLYVRKGESLFTIYSPDLVATQQEYLLARQNQKSLSASTVDGVASGATSLSAAAEQRLEQWQVPQSELQKLKDTGKPITDLTINSPVSGYVTEYNALPNMYVEPSTRLYTIADLSRIWVYAQVFQDDVERLKDGAESKSRWTPIPARRFAGTSMRFCRRSILQQGPFVSGLSLKIPA